MRCPQLVPIGTRTTRHFNKGYVCMYVCMSTGVSVAVTSGQTFLSRKENLTTVARVCF